MIFSFGDCQINAATFELSRAGELVKVEPQVLDLLLLLIENRDRIVSKSEIIENVWSGRIVSDAAVASRIKTARQLIGDTGKNQHFIRTVQGRGFRFVAQVDAETPGVGIADPAPVQFDTLSPHPATQYARSRDVHIAYQLFGDGPSDIVLAPGFVSQIDNYWDDPNFNRWLTALGKTARVAMFDKRGTGLSDPVPNLPGMDERMDDVRAVMDAVGFEKAVIMGISEGGSLASLFAASQPQRVTGLVLYGAFAQFTSWFPNESALQELFDYARSFWGTGKSVGQFAPSMIGDEDFRIWWGKFERLGATPGAVIDLMRMNKNIDISDIVPSITVPTLVIHRTHDTLIDVQGGRFLASNIPGARYFELPGKDHLPWVGENAQQIIGLIGDFLASLPKTLTTDRFVATVVVLKLEGKETSAATAENPLGVLDGPVQLAVARNGGTRIGGKKETIAARYSGPAKALRSAREIVDLLSKAGFIVHAGVHTGEVDLRDAAVGGLAAEIAESVANFAEQNEVIASRTVRDLVAGSGIEFEPAGTHSLARLGESWQLYRARK